MAAKPRGRFTPRIVRWWRVFLGRPTAGARSIGCNISFIAGGCGVVRKVYKTPPRRLGEAVLTAVVDSTDADEVYVVGGEIVEMDAATEIEVARLTVEAVDGATIAARVSWLNPAVYGGV